MWASAAPLHQRCRVKATGNSSWHAHELRWARKPRRDLGPALTGSPVSGGPTGPGDSSLLPLSRAAAGSRSYLWRQNGPPCQGQLPRPFAPPRRARNKAPPPARTSARPRPPRCRPAPAKPLVIFPNVPLRANGERGRITRGGWGGRKTSSVPKQVRSEGQHAAAARGPTGRERAQGRTRIGGHRPDTEPPGRPHGPVHLGPATAIESYPGKRGPLVLPGDRPTGGRVVVRSRGYTPRPAGRAQAHLGGFSMRTADPTWDPGHHEHTQLGPSTTRPVHPGLVTLTDRLLTLPVWMARRAPPGARMSVRAFLMEDQRPSFRSLDPRRDAH